MKSFIISNSSSESMMIGVDADADADADTVIGTEIGAGTGAEAEARAGAGARAEVGALLKSNTLTVSVDSIFPFSRILTSTSSLESKSLASIVSLL